jgi:hypothetical protein
VINNHVTLHSFGNSAILDEVIPYDILPLYTTSFTPSIPHDESLPQQMILNGPQNKAAQAGALAPGQRWFIGFREARAFLVFPFLTAKQRMAAQRDVSLLCVNLRNMVIFALVNSKVVFSRSRPVRT